MEMKLKKRVETEEERILRSERDWAVKWARFLGNDEASRELNKLVQQIANKLGLKELEEMRTWELRDRALKRYCKMRLQRGSDQ